MRRSLVIFLLLTFVLVVFLLHSVSTLLSLLFEDASDDAIHRSELPSPNATLPNAPPALIPKIIHQTYINESIPAHWVPAQQSCIDMHPDYEYKLWTDAKSHDFIAKEYPWFLPTFESYPHNIQRADSIRYFVLAHYGGVYIDLDDGCQRRLDPLLAYHAWVRRTVPTGISNDVMGAVPQHPFFVRVTESLQGANRAWVLPYITIMASTGPLFLSVMWKKWMGEHANVDRAIWPGRVRVLMPEEYNRHPWSFFTEFKGSSWHGKDARLIFWMGKNWVLLVFLGFALAAIVGVAVYTLYSRLLSLNNGNNGGSGSGGGGARRQGRPVKTPAWMLPIANRLPLLRNWSRGKDHYELVSQHDA